jgi:hypothetical protein
MSSQTLSCIAASIALVSLAQASTIVVDANNGPGANFTDIPPAIAAASPGDLLIVRAGTYSGFTLDRGLVMLGQGVVHTSDAHVVNIPASQRAVIVHMIPYTLEISACAGPVVVQDVSASGGMSVLQSNDVRFANVQAGWNFYQTIDGLFVDGSRVELVDSYAQGWQGAPGGTPFQAAGTGGRGLGVGPGSRVQVVRSDIDGGYGGDAYVQTAFGGNGGAAIGLTAPCEIFLVGPGSTVQGANGGYGDTGAGECYNDGAGSCAIVGSGDVHDDAGTTIHGGITNQQFHCLSPMEEPRFCGPNELPIAPADPSLQVTGTPAGGASITFTVYGEPGATASIYLGRGMIVMPTPGVDIEQLAPHNRVIQLGVIPPSGQASRTVALPASYPQGLVFVAQAEITGSNGLRRTNSTPIVLR